MKSNRWTKSAMRWVGNLVVAFGLIFAERTAFAQIVTTFAGSGERGHADGMGSAASFSGPRGLAVDPSGTLYVADSENLRIRKITPDSLVTTFAGSGLSGYDAGPGPSARFFGPLNVAMDPFGNVWVADQDDFFDGQYLKRITPAGFVTNLLLYPGYYPVALAFDTGGALYVADYWEGIWKISKDLKSASRISSNQTQGMAVDRAGNAYLTFGNRIDKIAPDGTMTTFAGSERPGSADGIGTSASFHDPYGLAVDEQGKVYVADRGNNKIRMITPDGRVTTLAGSGKQGGADGAATEASFNAPTGVAVDLMGDVYVADSGNHSIRRISMPAAANACVPDSTTLCLAGGRFQVTTRWTTPAGAEGSGQAVALAGGDTGYFTFFTPENVEVAVKVVNGCSSNGSHWFFAGGLTNAGVVTTVADTQTGIVRSYWNPQGSPFLPIQDTTSFGRCGAGEASVGARPYEGSASLDSRPPAAAESAGIPAAAPCLADATTMCLNHSRYEVRAQWFTPDGNSGAGQVIPLTADTGAFWFFSPGNLEVVVKVLNGCGVNSRYWTFAAGLTDVRVVLTVTDTQTGLVRTYTNPQGIAFEPVQDSDAFPSCSVTATSGR